MGRQHQVSMRQYVEDDFHCPRCKTMGRARYLAKGSGRWVKEGLFGDATSAQEESAHSAAMSLSRDAEVVKSYLKCPACHLRSPRAFMWTRVGVVLFATSGGAFLALAGESGRWLGLGAFALAIYIAGLALARRSRANDATFSMVERGPDVAAVLAGTQKKKEPAKPAKLPQARIASIAKPAPVVPVRTSAPEIVEPRRDADGPAFLK